MLLLTFFIQIKIFKYFLDDPPDQHDGEDPGADTASDRPQWCVEYRDSQLADAEAGNRPESDDENEGDDTGAGFPFNLLILFFLTHVFLL